ncbi:MAG: TPM domain-containing protein, partial [Microbacterium sp.]
LDSLQKADAEIDQAIAGGVGQVQQTQRAGQMLDQTILQAQAQVNAAEQFLSSRRGAVGADARTRLAQAGADLSRAQSLRESDPAQALSLAQNALNLASEAQSLAQNDVGAFSSNTSSSGSGGDFLSGLLGGIIGSSLGGSSRRSSGWGGGGFFGGGGGGGGGIFGGSSSSHGGFGGGRSSSHRSSGGFGGGRSSGGGRSGGSRRGGRF